MNLHGTYKDIERQTKLATIGAFGTTLGTVLTTSFYIQGLPAMLVTLPVFLSSWMLLVKEKGNYRDAIRCVSRLKDNAIWKEEIDKYQINMDVHLKDYITYGQKWLKETYPNESDDIEIRRSRIRSILGNAYMELGVGQSKDNIRLFPEALTLINDHEYDSARPLFNLDDLDTQVLLMSKKERCPDMWLLYLKDKDEPEFISKLQLGLNMDLNANDLITFINSDSDVIITDIPNTIEITY